MMGEGEFSKNSTMTSRRLKQNDYYYKYIYTNEAAGDTDNQGGPFENDAGSTQGRLMNGKANNRRIALKSKRGLAEDGTLTDGFIPYSQIAKPTLE